jgi:hypothetical protein
MILVAAAGLAVLILRRIVSLVRLPTLLLAAVLASTVLALMLAPTLTTVAATLPAVLASALLSLLRIALRLVALRTPLRGVAAGHVSASCLRVLNEFPIGHCRLGARASRLYR